jgi:hypothetical protein
MQLDMPLSCQKQENMDEQAEEMVEVGSAMSPKNLICNTGKVAKAERFQQCDHDQCERIPSQTRKRGSLGVFQDSGVRK